MRRNGFTLIELLVVIVIIGILVAIALPNFIKIKDKAKEAEVKQNLHAIQLALERYSTDSDGNYPYFLYGGDAFFNMGTLYGMDGHVSGHQPGNLYDGQKCINPFDMFFVTSDGWDYSDTSFQNLIDADPDLPATFGDTLAYEGYMPKYPGNPFTTGKTANQMFGLDSYLVWAYNYYACWGGKDGTKMFNTGWMSELNQLQMFSDPEQRPASDMPGNFSYHARWSDGVTNFGHMTYQRDSSNGDAYLHTWSPGYTLAAQEGNLGDPKIASLDVAGYDLTATGSPRTKGDDLDDTVFISGEHMFRSGYLTLGQERNPYIQDGMYDGTVEDFDERPRSDGVWDFTIIHLASGIDKKSGNPQDDTT